MFSENLNRNIYYCKEIRLAENFITKERKGARDTKSIAADPQFIDMSRGDFSFRANSPAKTLDIKPISLNILQEIGCSWDTWLPRAIETSGFPIQTNRSQQITGPPKTF
jgi:hypothetical protein